MGIIEEEIRRRLAIAVREKLKDKPHFWGMNKDVDLIVDNMLRKYASEIVIGLLRQNSIDL